MTVTVVRKLYTPFTLLFFRLSDKNEGAKSPNQEGGMFSFAQKLLGVLHLY